MSKERWIVVRNWDKFQHYKDRSVPWIKFYTELTHDDEWHRLTAGRRGMLCSIWLEYAQSRCRLRAETLSLSRRTGLRIRQDDLKALSKAGFLTVSSRPNLEHVYMASRPTRARKEGEGDGEEKELPGRGSPTSLDSRNGTPDSENDYERELELQRLLKVVTNKDDRSADTLRGYAFQLPVGVIAKVRESSKGKEARYACAALKSELKERKADL